MDISSLMIRYFTLSTKGFLQHSLQVLTLFQIMINFWVHLYFCLSSTSKILLAFITCLLPTTPDRSGRVLKLSTTHSRSQTKTLQHWQDMRLAILWAWKVCCSCQVSCISCFWITGLLNWWITTFMHFLTTKLCWRWMWINSRSKKGYDSSLCK